MATQEPNVYAGLSVVIGGLMYARPKFFAKVMGELLFWVGEDKMTFGSDYGIWEPKWQIEGFVDWDYPSDEFSDFPRVTTATKKKILGLNAARLYDIKVPEEYQLPVVPSAREAEDVRPAGHGVMTATTDTTVVSAALAALTTVRDPELDEPITTLGFVASCAVSCDGRAVVRLRLPTYFCAPNFAFLMVADAYDAVTAVPGVTTRRGDPGRPLRLRRDQRGGRRAGGLRRRPSTARRWRSSATCAPSSSARRSWPAPTWCAARWSTPGSRRPSCWC